MADEALALGFDALELSFHTTSDELVGYRARLDQMPVDSVHAYCPVPVGAPSGHPELFQLCAPEEDARALARSLLKQSLETASEMGAHVVVMHAGYVSLDGLFTNLSSDVGRHFLKNEKGLPDPTRKAYQKYLARAHKRRTARGLKMLDVFRHEMDLVLPLFEKAHVTLALENLPSLEGFPNASEAESLMQTFASSPLRLWFDTGHARVRAMHQWSASEKTIATRLAPFICGMHLNDVKDFHDDHREPGWGHVNFEELSPLANQSLLRVFESHQPVTFEELKASLARMRALWAPPTSSMPHP